MSKLLHICKNRFECEICNKDNKDNEGFIIQCKKCGSVDTDIFSGSIGFIKLTKIICKNKECGQVKQVE